MTYKQRWENLKTTLNEAQSKLGEWLDEEEAKPYDPRKTIDETIEKLSRWMNLNGQRNAIAHVIAIMESNEPVTGKTDPMPTPKTKNGKHFKREDTEKGH